MTYNHTDDDEQAVERRELAAAGLINDINGILHTAVLHSGLTQAEIASRMGVGASRVSQILNGEGNLRIATLGRFLGSLGLRLAVDLVETDAPRKRRRRNKKEDSAGTKRFSVWGHTVITPAGAHPAFVIANDVTQPADAIHSTGSLIFDANDHLSLTPQDLEIELPVEGAGPYWAFPVHEVPSPQATTQAKESSLASYS